MISRFLRLSVPLWAQGSFPAAVFGEKSSAMVQSIVLGVIDFYRQIYPQFSLQIWQSLLHYARPQRNVTLSGIFQKNAYCGLTKTNPLGPTLMSIMS